MLISVTVMMRATTLIASLAAVAALAACGAGNGPVSENPGAPASTSDAPAGKDAERMPAGKPTAPIAITYEVIGTPIVGRPVSVNLQVRSTQADRPMRLQYRSNEVGGMLFPEAQPLEVEIGALNNSDAVAQQVTVIPQREGRLYLNVSASVETSQGTMFRSLAIPIQVGSAPDSGPTVNGELKQTAEGETVISMPAEEQ